MSDTPEKFEKQLTEADARNAQMFERLQMVEMELEQKDLQIEECFAKASALIMEAELARIEFEQIFNAATDGMWIVDDKFNVVRLNKALSRFLGKTATQAIGRKCYDLFPCSLCRTDDCSLALNLAENCHYERDLDIKTGEEVKSFIVSSSRYLGLDNTLLGMVASFKEITERKHAATMLYKANQELQSLTFTDGLTQIANRRCFDDIFRQEWQRMARAKRSLSLIMCDVDHFKLYNDHYGHLAGDSCLISISHAISSFCKRPADLAARYGGEEFIVILPETDACGAVVVAESIRLGVQELAIDHAASPIHAYVTLSLGVSSTVPQSGGNPQALLEASDYALYEAKRAGRNRVCEKSIFCR